MTKALIAWTVAALWSGIAMSATPQEARRLWTERAQALGTEQEALEQRTSAASRAFMASGPTDLASMQKDAVGVYAAAEAASIASGRARMLRAWLAHLPTKPSATAARAWVQERTRDLEEAARLSALSETNLKASIAAGSVTPFDSVVALYRIVMMHGDAEGAALELRRIGGELASHYGAERTASDGSDVALGGIAGRLRQERTALRDWVATCNRTSGWPGCTAG